MLTLSAQAYMKLVYFAKKYTHEVSGFGISSTDNPFYVKDIVMVKQENDAASTEMGEEGLEQYMDTMLQKGLNPCEFMRIWCHTHPVGVNSPSSTDKDTMKEVFGKCDWAIMLILTKELKTYAEIHTKLLGHTVKTIADVKVDWTSEGSTDTKAWEQEHDENHSPIQKTITTYTQYPNGFVYGENKHENQKNGFYYRQNRKVEDKQKTKKKDEDSEKQNLPLFQRATSMFWDFDILEYLRAHGLVDEQCFNEITEELIAGKTLHKEFIDMYKESSGDWELAIAQKTFSEGI